MNIQLWFPRVLNFSNKVKSLAIEQPIADSSTVEATTFFDSPTEKK